jgi:diguanylate cyclase (GGDEF)-like protein
MKDEAATITEEADQQPGSTFQSLLADLKLWKRVRSDDEQVNAEILARVRDFEKVSPGGETKKIIEAKSEDIERLAFLEPITELYNYKSFVKELQAELVRARRYKYSVAICLLHVDNYESIKGQYGIITAEAVLKIIANVLRSRLREIDIAARGNEKDGQFIIALPHMNAAGASLLAERLRKRIGNQVIMHNRQCFSLKASLGVTSYPEHASHYDVLIARALEAMEHAIDRGGDRVLSI